MTLTSFPTGLSVIFIVFPTLWGGQPNQRGRSHVRDRPAILSLAHDNCSSSEALAWPACPGWSSFHAWSRTLIRFSRDAGHWHRLRERLHSFLPKPRQGNVEPSCRRREVTIMTQLPRGRETGAAAGARRLGPAARLPTAPAGRAIPGPQHPDPNTPGAALSS